jgi:FXSXX-COOH protein
MNPVAPPDESQAAGAAHLPTGRPATERTFAVEVLVAPVFGAGLVDLSQVSLGTLTSEARDSNLARAVQRIIDEATSPVPSDAVSAFQAALIDS